MTVQIIRSPGGEEMVLMSRADYEVLLSAARDEEEDDIALYDARKAELAANPVKTLPADVGAALLRGESRLHALRRWRNLTQKELASRAGITQGYFSELESGAKKGASETVRRLAEALDIPDEWIA
ncbi:MAG: helix-turn-helix transcriptional regulator [Phyllobacteriaceae bacterium]|nr:helix-turn-helix transcriptional regulator [Phyllobacteriaceae bacterium]